MAKVKFIKKTENGCIYVRVRVGRIIDITTTTHLHLPSEDWDADNGFPKTKIRDGARYKRNEKIRKQLFQLEHLIKEKTDIPDVNKITKKVIDEIINPPSIVEITPAKILLNNYVDEYVKDPNKNLAEGSVKHALTSFKRHVSL